MTNLLEFSSKVLKGFHEAKQTDVIYTDFSKAFDSNIHDLLLCKLANIGLPTLLVNWIKSYLSARVQKVIFNGVISAKEILVSSGVPQGSHLGPILFNLFINDLPSVILHSSVLMYADDVKIFSTVDPSTHGSPLQEDFNRLCVWCDRNGLALNCAKCKIMSFSRRSISQFSYCLGNTTLERVQIFCDLGITMDIRLRYDVHINLVINKAKGVLAVV